MAYGVILAGGSGTRMGTATPKQFLPLCGKPVIMHSVETFCSSEEIEGVVLVCRKDHMDELRTLTAHLDKVMAIVPGGDTRQESVYAGLCALKAKVPPKSIVLIHDGARPLVTHAIIADCAKTVAEHGSANTVCPCQDTMLISDDGEYPKEQPPRNECYTVQTPQGFVLQDIIMAHILFMGRPERFHFTDDCGLYLVTRGKKSHLCKGDKRNLKITTPIDLAMAEAILTAEG
ncbi:MAG: 2-C-methyl-D-erythritol 4-phosphate cytidylyltransferase [Clostridiales bacterium]|nr:2-C-methyl-D-erythritol 4-phosphate cytidylyltransferase [Clostridiales bacterium]